jgi:anti-sigma factor RsiW
MTDPGLPTYLNRGLSLTHAELCTELGKELLLLCRSVTADGRLSPEELAALRQWLSDAETAAMPAAQHLRVIIAKVLADGKITPEEYREVHRAVEATLPFDARREAMHARLEVEAAEEAAASAARAERRRDGGPHGTVFRVTAIVALLLALGAVAIWMLG